MKRYPNIRSHVKTSLAVALVLTVAALSAVASAENPGEVKFSGHSNHHEVDDHREVKIKMKGDIYFDESGEKILRMSRRARVTIVEEVDGDRRQLKVRADDDGKPQFEYRVNGEKLAFDERAGDWLAAKLQDWKRSSRRGKMI